MEGFAPGPRAERLFMSHDTFRAATEKKKCVCSVAAYDDYDLGATGIPSRARRTAGSIPPKERPRRPLPLDSPGRTESAPGCAPRNTPAASSSVPSGVMMQHRHVRTSVCAQQQTARLWADRRGMGRRHGQLEEHAVVVR